MASKQVAIVDSGGANIASLRFALDRLGVASLLTTDADELRAASHVILPGVGAAEDAMQRLKARNLDRLLPTLEQPVLGICLGMQLLATASAEDDANCLGILDGRAEKLDAEPGLPVPNMGWSQVTWQQAHPISKGIDDGSYFYFVHSYALPALPETIATSHHSSEFSAIVARDNFVATQFHPERSSDAGAQLLSNFVEMAA